MSPHLLFSLKFIHRNTTSRLTASITGILLASSVSLYADTQYINNVSPAGTDWNTFESSLFWENTKGALEKNLWVQGNDAEFYQEGSTTASSFAFRLYGSNITANSLTKSGSKQLALNAGNTLLLTLTSGVITVDQGVLLLNANVYSTQGLIKEGTGMLNMNNSGNSLQKSYVGDTVINAGTLNSHTIDDLLPFATKVSVASGATFSIGTQTIAGLSGGGTTTVAENKALTIINNVNSNFSGVIGGNGNIIKEGSGALTFSGNDANTRTGTTTVKSGVLEMEKSANVISINGDLSIENGNVLVKNAGQIASTSNLNLNGGGLSFSSEDTSQLTFTLSTLTLLSNTTLDFGDISGGVLFSMNEGTYDNGLLQISNWSDGVDQLQTASLLSQGFLDSIHFAGYGQGAQLVNNTFGYEIRPIPEAGVSLLLLAGLGHVMSVRNSRKRKL